jgi:hypothetical protein
VTRDIKIRIAVIDPGMNALRGAVRECEVDINNDAVVVDGCRNGDGFWI